MVPQQHIVNIDQTPVKMVPVSEYTMSGKGADSVSVIGGDDKKMFTAVFSASNEQEIPPHATDLRGKNRELSPENGFPTRFPRNS